jgi:hypothetical protein
LIKDEKGDLLADPQNLEQVEELLQLVTLQWAGDVKQNRLCQSLWVRGCFWEVKNM